MMRQEDVQQPFFIGMAKHGLLARYPTLVCEDCGNTVEFNAKGFLLDGEEFHISEVNYCPFCGSKAENDFDWDDENGYPLPIVRDGKDWKVDENPKHETWLII